MQVSDPIHLPCPDMAGMENPDAKRLQRSQILLQKLREKYGIKKRVKLPSQPLNFICTERGCIEPWGTTNNAGGELDES